MCSRIEPTMLYLDRIKTHFPLRCSNVRLLIAGHVELFAFKEHTNYSKLLRPKKLLPTRRGRATATPRTNRLAAPTNAYESQLRAFHFGITRALPEAMATSRLPSERKHAETGTLGRSTVEGIQSSLKSFLSCRIPSEPPLGHPNE